jgi:hypothetical protein
MARLSPNRRATHPSRTRSRVAPGGGGSRAAGRRRAVPSPPTPGAERPRRCPPVPLFTPRSGPTGNRRTRRSQSRGCDRGSTAPAPASDRRRARRRAVPSPPTPGAERPRRCPPVPLFTPRSGPAGNRRTRRR